MNLNYARKYRPKVIQEYVGADIKDLVWDRFSEGSQLPQAILIHGELGCGKTTLARILTKEYHCQNKVNGHACGQCAMCKALEDYVIHRGEEIMGVQEVDIGVETGKANIDTILEDAVYPPIPPLNYKILILDEFQMASLSAQNRLLKIVEEPPKHLIFIFCTTAPEKLLSTLRSRCTLKIAVQKPTEEELLKRLLYISEQEKLTVSQQSLKALIRANQQIPRDTISMLEEIALRNGNIVDLDTVAKHIGKVANEIYIEFYRAANSSISDILLFSKKLKNKGIPPKQFMRGLIQFSMDCLYLRNGISIDEYSKEQAKALAELFKIYNDSQIDYLLQILEYASNNMGDNMHSELLLLTTALRVSKLPGLLDDLSQEREVANKENQKAYNTYIAAKKQEEEEKPVQVKKVPVTDSLMSTVFGKKLASVPNTVKIEKNKKAVSLDPTEITKDISVTVDTETIIKKILGES